MQVLVSRHPGKNLKILWTEANEKGSDLVHEQPWQSRAFDLRDGGYSIRSDKEPHLELPGHFIVLCSYEHKLMIIETPEAAHPTKRFTF